MRLIQRRFAPEGDYIEIVGAGDLHWGNACFLAKPVAAHRKYVMGSPDRYTIDLGDPVENSLRDSVGAGVYEQTLRPRDQLKEVREYYEGVPLLGICESNHPDRSVKCADFSPTEYLCDTLRVPYIRYDGILAVTVGNSAKGFTYLLHVRHFVGGAATPEGISRQLRLKSQYVQGCDVHLAAHCHWWTQTVEPVYYPDVRHGKVRMGEKFYSTCSSFLGHSGSYGEGKAYALPAFGMVSIKLYQSERKVEVGRLVY